MGESRAKKKAHSQVLEACPYCIYCGGAVSAASIDHVPPLAMFRGRRRPKGLEFASCKDCNEGTGRVDLVAALLSRVAPDAKDEEEKAELKKLLTGVSNNVPGLLEEMHLGADDLSAARKRLPQYAAASFLKTDGPLVSAHMQTFATKLGFALYYELTGKIVPDRGGVAARWFSNVDRLEGTFPQSVFDILLPPLILEQGKFEVSDQFSYQWRLAENERMGLFFASFRHSFAVLAFVTTDVALFDMKTAHPLPIITPRTLKKLLGDRV
ncbi:hypothetical protein ACVWWG_004055 [Bradyrhizobium sp. LB7.2]|uniref:hypothetical protein n=1 Tax=Bradyrhizobium sp. LB14.3 TaxID=3156328 RepID=UPI003392B19A